MLAAEAVHAARSEMAVRLEDFMLRRTTMAWHFPALAAGAAAKAARLMGSELGWNDERVAAELAQFSAALESDPGGLTMAKDTGKDGPRARAGPDCGGAGAALSASPHQPGLH